MSEIRTRTIEANGLRFLIDEAGEGDKVALLLHGFPQSRRCWRHQLVALAALGWRAVAPDMRGYGGSGRPEEESAYRIEHLVADATGLFEALGAKRRLLIGHDWGGVVAWAFAIRQALPLDALVIVNAPHPAVFRRAIRNGWRQRLRSWYIAWFQLPWLPEQMLATDEAALIGRTLETSAREGTFPPEILAHYRANAAAPGAMTAMLNYYRANMNPLVGEAREDQTVAVPTLLVWGEQDSALGPELVAPTAYHVSDLTVRRLPDASHWVPEEAPEEVNAALAAWLRERGLAS
jgi:pimeloyl-ACP methyl ester carboxylesterase